MTQINFATYVEALFHQFNGRTSVKNVFFAYFGIKLVDQDKAYAPHRVCRNCVSSLRQWSTGKQKSLAFGIPMVWREPKKHGKECYFCSCVVDGYIVKISIKFNILT